MTYIREDNFSDLLETFHDKVKEAIDLRVDYNGVILQNVIYPQARICGTVRKHCVVEMIYSDEDMTPYEVNVWDVALNKVYAWVHPDFITIRKAGFEERNIPGTRFEFPKHIVTESIEDILAKLTAIYNGDEYDDRIIMVVDLDSDTRRQLQELADAEGIDVETLMVRVLTDEIERIEAENAAGESTVP